MVEEETFTEEDTFIEAKNQNKDWRKIQSWYINGKKNECEKYQLQELDKIVNCRIRTSTNLRFNICDYTLDVEPNPMNRPDGFDFTEDFDGESENDISGIKILFNLKMVTSSGGSQTRTFREVYHFIKCQFEYLRKNQDNPKYFVNILDGDQGHRFTYGNKSINKASLLYLEGKEEYVHIKDYVYIGDLFHFKKWYQEKRVENNQ